MSDPRSLVKTPLSKRLTQAVSYGLSGGWFTPEMPLNPQQQQTAGRRFDFIAGYNIATRPRRDTGIDFVSLRNFATYYDIVRMLIEKRKDQIVNFEWSVTVKEELLDVGEKASDEQNERIKAVTQFLKRPDDRKPWNQWLRTIVEDFLVLDAVVFWPVYEGRQLKTLEIIDPSTIKIVIDEQGRRPEPPYPAYQQVLHGVPTANFQKDELLYFISNPASNRVYGLSKIEQVLITIQIGLRREVSQLQYFTDGNVPAALAGVPDNWNAQQIALLQASFDAMLQGDTAARRKIWFIPGDAAKNIKEFRTEEATLKTEFDEWVIRLLCFNFGISPTPFTKQVNRATAESASEEAREEGLGPTLAFLKDCIDDVIAGPLGMDDLEFRWSTELDVDPATQATIDDMNVRNGIQSIDDIRQRQGLEPLGVGNMVFLPTGPIPLSSIKDGTAAYLQPKPAPSAPGGGGAPKKPKPDDGSSIGGGGNDPPAPTDNSKDNQTLDEGDDDNVDSDKSIAKGDKPGHEFRGNQYAQGSGDGEPVSMQVMNTAPFASDMLERFPRAVDMKQYLTTVPKEKLESAIRLAGHYQDTVTRHVLSFVRAELDRRKESQKVAKREVSAGSARPFRLRKRYVKKFRY